MPVESDLPLDKLAGAEELKGYLELEKLGKSDKLI